MRQTLALASLLGALFLGAACGKEASAEPPAAAPSPAKSAAVPAADAVAIALNTPHDVLCVDDSLQKVACGAVTITVDPTTAGGAAVAHVVLAPKGIFHVNKDFPINLAVTADGVDFPKAKLGAEDALKLDATGAAFDVKFTAKDAGDKTFNATFRFAVCTDKTCNPSIEKLSWKVPVK